MTAKPSGKTGWTQHEQDILFEQAKKARDLGLPLKAAFDQTARLTGRQPNSIRNFYYAKIKEEGLEAPMGASAFIPFTDEEIRHLLEQVLTLASPRDERTQYHAEAGPGRSQGYAAVSK